MLYFAYGSNLDVDRLTSRIGEVAFGGIAAVAGFQLRFNKRSNIDGSGKANLVEIPGGVVEGVLFEMDEAQFARLDVSEKGYHREIVRVTCEGRTLDAVTYFADDDQVAEGLRPTQEYLALVVGGAASFGLSGEHRQWIVEVAR